MVSKNIVSLFFPDDVTRAHARTIHKYQELELSMIKLTGYRFEELVTLFAKGYTLAPPEPSASLIEAINRRYGARKAPFFKECSIEVKGD